MKWHTKQRERNPKGYRLTVMALEEARQEMREPDETERGDLPRSLPGSGWMSNEREAQEITLAGRERC